MYFDRYAVSMTMREDGLSGDVTLHTVDLGAAPAGAAGPENTDAGG